MHGMPVLLGGGKLEAWVGAAYIQAQGTGSGIRPSPTSGAANTFSVTSVLVLFTTVAKLLLHISSDWVPYT